MGYSFQKISILLLWMTHIIISCTGGVDFKLSFPYRDPLLKCTLHAMMMTVFHWVYEFLSE